MGDVDMPPGRSVRPRKWSDVVDLYDDGEYAAIWGRYEGEQRKKLGVRWNGSGKKLGFPSQCGHSIWHVEPEFLTEAILQTLICQETLSHEERKSIKKALQEFRQP